MPRRKKDHLRLEDASEEQIEQMQNEGRVDADEDDTADEEFVGSGREERKPPVIFNLADPVETLGRTIIASNYPKLKGQRVIYVYASEARKSAGEPVIVDVKCCRGLNAWLALNFVIDEATEGPADPFFLVIVSQSHWELMALKDKTAALDEALWKCDVRETGALYLRKPEVQTAVAVVHRNGLYTNKLQDLGRVAKTHIENPELPLEEAS